MSSSVSYAYTVRQEALRRERERRAAEDAVRTALARHEALREMALTLRGTWGDSIELPAAGEAAAATDVGGLRRAKAAVEERTEAARRRLDQQVRAARVATLQSGLAELGDGTSTVVDAATALASARRAEPAPDPSEVEAETEATILRVVGRLDPEADAAWEAKAASAVAAVRGESSAIGREQSLAALRLCVQEANAAAAASARRRVEVEALGERLDGCRGPEAGAARALLAAALAGEVSSSGSLEAAVESALAAEERRARADYVSRKLGSILAEMGYEVGPEFSTTLAASGEALASRPGWAGYAVAVRCAGDPAQLDFDVVRGATSRPDQAARDLEVEREFCAARPELLDELARSGIDASQARLVEAGTAELRVEPRLGEARAGERSAASRPKERES